MTDLRSRILAVRMQAEAVLNGPIGHGFAIGFHMIDSESDEWPRPLSVEGAFIVRHNPATVIADCDADLALLDSYYYDHGGWFPVSAVVKTNLEARYPA